MRNKCVLLANLALLAIPLTAQPAPSTQDGPLSITSVPPKPDKDGVYQVGPGIESPELMHAADAAYPPGATETDVPHIVLLSAVIGIDGTARIREVIRPRGVPFEDLAADAVRDSQFRPGTLDGSPVPVLVCIRVPFFHLRPVPLQLVPCSRITGMGGFGASNPQPPDPFRLPRGAKPPTLVHSVDAQYSDEARREKIEGVVIVSMIVNEEGLPTDIRLVRGVGHGLDENALAEVSQYRFQPALLDGKAIATRIAVEVNFHLY